MRIRPNSMLLFTDKEYERLRIGIAAHAMSAIIRKHPRRLGTAVVSEMDRAVARGAVDYADALLEMLYVRRNGVERR